MNTKDIPENHERGTLVGVGSSEGLGAGPEARCMCKDRALSGCPGEWEPGCDLGNNEAYVRVSQVTPDEQAALDAALGIERK